MTCLCLCQSGRGGVSVYVREAVIIIAGYYFSTFWRFSHLVIWDVSEGVMWVCHMEFCGCV